VSFDVLEEDGRRFALFNDSRDVREEMPRIFRPFSLPCAAERLTGIPRSDEIHRATPRAAVEGSKIRPDRSLIEGSVRKTRSQDRRGSCFDFHITDGSNICASDSSPKAESVISCAQFKGMYSHTL
jgi:hypothetical protein